MAFKLKKNISIKEIKGKNKPRRQIVSNRPDYIPGLIEKKMSLKEAASPTKHNNMSDTTKMDA